VEFWRFYRDCTSTFPLTAFATQKAWSYGLKKFVISEEVIAVSQ
jgi:hypothetical protein